MTYLIHGTKETGFNSVTPNEETEWFPTLAEAEAHQALAKARAKMDEDRQRIFADQHSDFLAASLREAIRRLEN